MKSIVTLAIAALALTLSACSGDVASPAAAPQGARKTSLSPDRQFFVHASASPVLRLGNRVNVYGVSFGGATTYLGVVSTAGPGKSFGQGSYVSLLLRAYPTADCTLLDWMLDDGSYYTGNTLDTSAVSGTATDIEARFLCN